MQAKDMPRRTLVEKGGEEDGEIIKL